MNTLHGKAEKLNTEKNQQAVRLLTWLAFSVICMIVIYLVFDIAMSSS